MSAAAAEAVEGERLQDTRGEKRSNEAELPIHTSNSKRPRQDTGDGGEASPKPITGHPKPSLAGPLDADRLTRLTPDEWRQGYVVPNVQIAIKTKATNGICGAHPNCTADAQDNRAGGDLGEKKCHTRARGVKVLEHTTIHGNTGALAAYTGFQNTHELFQFMDRQSVSPSSILSFPKQSEFGKRLPEPVPPRSLSSMLMFGGRDCLFGPNRAAIKIAGAA